MGAKASSHALQLLRCYHDYYSNTNSCYTHGSGHDIRREATTGYVIINDISKEEKQQTELRDALGLKTGK